MGVLFPLLAACVMIHDSMLVHSTCSNFRQNFGDEMVEVENGKKENRNRGLEVMKLKEFIKYYERADIYMVHTLPDSMKGVINSLISLLSEIRTNSNILPGYI